MPQAPYLRIGFLKRVIQSGALLVTAVLLAALCASKLLEAADAGLLIHWTFDEAAGTVAVDTSGNLTDGAITGYPSYVPGVIGTALELNRTPEAYDYVSTAKRIPAWQGDYTISLWVKAAVTGQPSYSTVFNNYDTDGGPTSDSLQIDVDGGTPGNYRVLTGKSYPIAAVTSSWQLLTVTLRGTTLKTYNNGILTNSYTLADGESNVFRQYVVGINRNGNRLFNGAIDELRVYNRALGDAEVQAVYQFDSVGYGSTVSSPSGTSYASGGSTSSTTGTNTGTVATLQPSSSGTTNSYSVITTGTSATLSNGLVAYWRLDDASGAVARDASGQNNHGSLIGGPVWADGKVAGALSFDGIDDYAAVNTIASGNWQGDYSVALWVKATATGQRPFASVFNNYKNLVTGGTQDSFQIDVDGGVPGKYRLWTAKEYSIASVTTEWQFLTVTLSGTTLRTYHNGLLTNTYALAKGESNLFRSYLFGVNRAGNTFFKGLIDETRVYNRALTDSEVAALYQQAFPTPTTATPVIAPNGGSFKGTTSISLSSSTSGATIYYTTNGMAVTQASLPYNGPFALTASTVVKAKAFMNGYNESAEASAWFTKEEFDYALAQDGDKSITIGASVTKNITTTLTSGAGAPVSFSASGLPTGTSAFFSATSCIPDCATVLTINTTGSPQPGTYPITITANGGGVSKSSIFVLTLILSAATPASAAYNLSAPASVEVGKGLTVTWTAPSGSSATDWVGLFKSGDSNRSFIVGKLMYTNGRTSGSFTTTAPTSAGTYEFRYLLNDGYTDAARSNAIAVTSTVATTPAPTPTTSYSLSNSVSSVTAGGNIKVTWTAPSGSSTRDWIALYETGAANTSYLPNLWIYTNGATSGSYALSAPATPGTYEFRYLVNNGYTSVTQSSALTVTAPTTVVSTPTPTPAPAPSSAPTTMVPVQPTGAGRTYYVALSGSDSNDGSQSRPFRTIQKAADVAKPGDVVNVAPGTYNERVQVKTSGALGTPITFQGQAGAVVDAGDIVTGWELSTDFCAGIGLYKKRISDIGFTPYNLTWNDKHVVWVNNSAMQSSWGETICHADGAWWDGREALAGNSGGYTYLRYRNGQNPNGNTIKLAPVNTGAFNIIGKSHIVVRGFTIKNGYNAVRINGASSNNVVEYNSLVAGVYFVEISNGAAQNIVRNNELTQNYIYADYGHPRDRSNADYNALDNNRVVGSMFGVGVYLYNAGAGNQVQRNHMYKIFAGVWPWVAVDGSPTAEMNKDIVIAENSFENCADFCILVHQTSAANLHVRDNTFHEYFMAVRFGPIYYGPIYFYRNRFSTDTQNSYQTVDLAFSFFGSSLPSTGVYFYHNSFASYGLTLSLYGETLANSYWLNNVFSSTYFMGGSAGSNPKIFGYNWIGGAGAFNFVGPSNRVFANQWLWDRSAPSFSLSGSSSADQIGLDLSKPWYANGVQQPPLPGMVVGYFSGTAPDAGVTQ